MVDHVIDVDVAERPADQKPAPAELAQVRADLRASLLPGCRELTHAHVACVTEATTSTAIAGCVRTR